MLRPNSNQHFVVDCEFESSTHELISMAIVPLWPDAKTIVKPVEDVTREFYEVLHPLPKDISPWVRENVIPHLGKLGISKVDFQRKLQDFLLAHEVSVIHYDWPEDIAYFNRVMITGPGTRIDIPSKMLTHVHHPGIDPVSNVKHNALEDARAIAAELRMRYLGMD